MRIFLTGATGYIGGAALDALVRGGHDVTALVRDGEKARRVARRGAHPIVGNLSEPESYRGAAEAQDGYVHAAFDSASGRGPAIDRTAIETLLAGAKQRAPLSSQQSGMRQRPPGRDLRSGGSRVGGSAKAREPRHARNLAAGSAAYDVACAAVIRTYGLRECVGLN